MKTVFIVTCAHIPEFYAVFNKFNDALESIKYSYHEVKDLKIAHITSNDIVLSGTNWQGLFFNHTFTITEVTPLSGIHHL